MTNSIRIYAYFTGDCSEDLSVQVIESLRWSHQCSDHEEEKKRLEDYKDKRRQRYMVLIEERRTNTVAQKLTSKTSNPFYYVPNSQIS